MTKPCFNSTRHATGKRLVITDKDYICVACSSPWHVKHLVRQQCAPSMPPPGTNWLCPRCTKTCCCQIECDGGADKHRCCHLRRKQLKERRQRDNARQYHSRPATGVTPGTAATRKRQRLFDAAANRLRDNVLAPQAAFRAVPAAAPPSAAMFSPLGSSVPVVSALPSLRAATRQSTKRGAVAAAGFTPPSPPSAATTLTAGSSGSGSAAPVVVPVSLSPSPAVSVRSCYGLPPALTVPVTSSVDTHPLDEDDGLLTPDPAFLAASDFAAGSPFAGLSPLTPAVDTAGLFDPLDLGLPALGSGDDTTAPAAASAAPAVGVDVDVDVDVNDASKPWVVAASVVPALTPAVVDTTPGAGAGAGAGASAPAVRPVTFKACACGCWKSAASPPPTACTLGFLPPSSRTATAPELQTAVRAAGFRSLGDDAKWSVRVEVAGDWLPLGDHQTLASLEAAMPGFTFSAVYIHLD